MPKLHVKNRKQKAANVAMEKLILQLARWTRIRNRLKAPRFEIGETELTGKSKGYFRNLKRC